MKKMKIHRVGKTGLWLLSLLFSALLHAQDDAPVDTTLAPPPVDSAVTVVEQPAGNDTVVPATDDTDSKDNISFINKNLPGGGIDSPSFRALNDSQKAAMKNQDDFWYANTVFDKKKEKKEDNESFFDGNLFQTLLWMIIVGGFIAFLVIYLSNSNIGLFRRTRIVKQEFTDPETDDIFAIEYSTEIEKAISTGNYRLAIRLLFLQTLLHLSDKQIIQYTQDRTNFDYLMQVQRAPWYNLFFRITRNYEYVWYGQFAIDREKFDVIRQDFTNLEQQLPA